MIPESLVTGELLPGISSQASAIALRLYAYLDLKQGKNGFAMRGLRYIAKQTGLQERSVRNAALNLEAAGVIEIDRQGGATKSWILNLIHNPARERWSPTAHLGPTPRRHRHDTLEYEGPVTDAHRTRENVQPARQSRGNPVAQVASGSRSIRYRWFDNETAAALEPLLSDDVRCATCLLLLQNPTGYLADVIEFCRCPYDVSGDRVLVRSSTQ